MPGMDGKNDYLLLTTHRQKKLICNNNRVEQIPFQTGMIDPLWEQVTLPGILKDYGVDVYHNPCFSLPVAKENTKFVTTIHDVVFKERPDLVEEKLCDYLDRWTEVACKVADKIITVSQYSKQKLIEFYKVDKNKIEVVYNGMIIVFKSQPEKPVKGKR